MVTTQRQRAPQTGAAKAEWVQLTILLLADVLFYFLIIPGSIVDPDNFGLDEGLPPSFSPRLVAALIAVLISFRSARLAPSRWSFRTVVANSAIRSWLLFSEAAATSS